MFTNFALIVVLWLAGKFVYGLDFAQLGDQLAQYVAANSFSLMGYGILGGVALPGISLACRAMGLYSFMYTMDKLFFWLGQFLLCLVSLGAVIFWFDIGVNLWAVLGAVALLPFLALGSAAFSLYLFDFNYPLKEALLYHMALPVLSLLIIWGSGFFPGA